MEKTTVSISEIYKDQEHFGIFIQNASRDLSQFGFVEESPNCWMKRFEKSASGLKACNEIMPKILQPDWKFEGMFLDKETLLKLKS